MKMETITSFYSILDLRKSPCQENKRPAFFADLNLDQVIDRIRRDWGENISSFYYYLPADQECEDYRREVFADVKNQGVYEVLFAFYKRMKTRREIFFKKEEVSFCWQRAVWHVQEAGCYCGAFEKLCLGLENAPLRSAGMRSFLAYLKAYIASADFQKMQEAADQLQKQLESVRLVLTYENDRIAVSAGEVEGAYDSFLQQYFPQAEKSGLYREGMRNPFEAIKELTELEQELCRLCRKLYPDFFQKIEVFYKRYEEYAPEVLTQFSSEIGYYLSFYRFEQRMRERGFSFAEPTILSNPAENPRTERHEAYPEHEEGEAGGWAEGTADNEMRVRGLYDLALACAACEESREIVSNDIEMGSGEGFFVLTGPNQGGKTTFARSLGQMVYFAKMGLDVPAVSARLCRFADILTHFSVEESVETGRGKLKEELERLAPMMESVRGEQTKAFIVINELFTTAANYDACIMGKRVLEFFLRQGCRGIYVTHLKELSGADPKIVSLRALLDEQGRHTYRIERSSAADCASAVRLVEKHGLKYDQLKKRLAGGTI